MVGPDRRLYRQGSKKNRDEWLDWLLDYNQEETNGYKACCVCRDIAKKDWCDDCEAPIVCPGNYEAVGLFISCLRVWEGGKDGGFNRAQVLATLDLNGVKKKRRAELWETLHDMERRTQMILQERNDGTEPK